MILNKFEKFEKEFMKIFSACRYKIRAANLVKARGVEDGWTRVGPHLFLHSSK